MRFLATPFLLRFLREIPLPGMENRRKEGRLPFREMSMHVMFLFAYDMAFVLNTGNHLSRFRFCKHERNSELL